MSWYSAVVSMVILYWLYKDGVRISYAGGVIGEPIKFALATFFGIYVHLYIAKILTKFKSIANFIACLGENSFCKCLFI